MRRGVAAHSRRSPRPRGFTVIELMVVVAIVGILAALAVPGYGAYIARSRVLDAAMRLADQRAKMEQYFLDRRAYDDGSGNCGVSPPSPASPGDAFAVACVATSSTYVVTATGLAAGGMAGFAFAIDHNGARATLAVPAGWTRTPDCWTSRPDGSCL